jgi:membrane protease YdiL (CAAX protease family)
MAGRYNSDNGICALHLFFLAACKERSVTEEIHMKEYIKNNWKFLLFVLSSGLIGGYCTGLYIPEMYSREMLQQLQGQGMTTEMLALSGAVQYGILYGVILGAIGLLISKKVGLWKEIRFDKNAVVPTAIISIIGALCLFPGDKLIFGRFSSWVNDLYHVSPGLPKIISGLLVGGVIEEVMMRLFFMSLLALIISKLFCKNEKNIPVWVFAAANIISALLFAAGHLPGTMAMTTLTPLLLFRCLLFNGGLGLCFGWLYRKYGIVYAMIAHGFAHLISDLLMVIFI